MRPLNAISYCPIWRRAAPPNENTVIMLERSVRSDDPAAPGGWQITESRNYGETAVFYIESADDDSDIERSDDSAA